MSAETEPTLGAPECTICEGEMEFVDSGTDRTVPLIGTEVEYQRFSCPECGQAVRFERTDAGEEWTRAGT